MTTFLCDRCGSPILGNRSVVQALRGKLSLCELGNGVDLCETCTDGVLRWFYDKRPPTLDVMIKLDDLRSGPRDACDRLVTACKIP